MMARRPHQVVEVIDALSPEALSLRLKALTEGGFFISTMTSVTTEAGKPVVIIVGTQQQLRPPQPGQAPGAQGPGAPALPSGQPPQPASPSIPPPPAPAPAPPPR